MKKTLNNVLPLIGIFLFVVFVIWAVIPKSNPEGATRALEDAGYKNITIKGAQFTGCGNGDIYKTSFKATGQSGREVQGVVCGGFFKGNTIRTY